jgi:hypothetical protein
MRYKEVDQNQSIRTEEKLERKVIGLNKEVDITRNLLRTCFK